MPVGAVLVAAGRGRRFGAGGPPKQFRSLNGRPLFHWPLRVLERTPAVTAIVMVVPQDRRLWTDRYLKRAGFKKVVAVVPGGAERFDSVRAGLRALPGPCDLVLVHDAARALVTRPVVDRVIRAARRTGAALAAWPVPDTIKEGVQRAGRWSVRRTVPRAGLWLAQTPQGFRRTETRAFFEMTGPLTDDVQALERSGRPVEIVRGSADNFKVTLPEDFDLCRRLLTARKDR